MQLEFYKVMTAPMSEYESENLILTRKNKRKTETAKKMLLRSAK